MVMCTSGPVTPTTLMPVRLIGVHAMSAPYAVLRTIPPCPRAICHTSVVAAAHSARNAATWARSPGQWVGGGAGGIEPPSAEWQLSARRPFPRTRLAVTSLPGQLGRSPPPGLSPRPAVFPAVSLLSGCHPPLLLPGCGGRPRAPLLVTMSLFGLSYQAARANSPSAVLWLPPFKESEATPVARSSSRSRRRNRSAPGPSPPRPPAAGSG